MDLTVEQRLRRLEDREEIRELLMEYGRTLDNADADGYSRLFASDGEWAGGGFASKTPAKIKEMIERLVANRPAAAGSSHILTNVIMEIDGDAANAWSRWFLFIPGETGKPTVRVAGQYKDDLVREDGRWKFRRRTLTHDLQAKAP